METGRDVNITEGNSNSDKTEETSEEDVPPVIGIIKHILRLLKLG